MYVILYTVSPDAPKNLHIPKYDKRSCDLTWDKPDFDGGNPISGKESFIKTMYFSLKNSRTLYYGSPLTFIKSNFVKRKSDLNKTNNLKICFQDSVTIFFSLFQTYLSSFISQDTLWRREAGEVTGFL